MHAFILGKMVPGKVLYVFLDEIQHVKDYEKVVDSLYARAGIDLYITGSTANLLSSEIATLLTGRFVEINVLPFSFRESVFGREVSEANQKKLFMDYLTYGGLPGAREFANGSSAQREYVEGVFRTIIEKDVLKRTGKGRFVVDRIIRYLADTVGSLTSPKRLADRMDDEKRTRVSPSWRSVARMRSQSSLRKLSAYSALTCSGARTRSSQMRPSSMAACFSRVGSTLRSQKFSSLSFAAAIS